MYSLLAVRVSSRLSCFHVCGLVITISLLLVKSCKMASANNQHCFVATITDEKLPGYRHHHDNIWPEVAAGLRTAGIASLKIYAMPSGKPGLNTLGENINFIRFFS